MTGLSPENRALIERTLGRLWAITFNRDGSAIGRLLDAARAEGAELSSDNPSKPTPGGDGRWTQAAPKTSGQADVREATIQKMAEFLRGVWNLSCEDVASKCFEMTEAALAAPPEGEVGAPNPSEWLTYTEANVRAWLADRSKRYAGPDNAYGRTLEALSRQAATTPVGETSVAGLWRDQALGRLERVRAHRFEFGSDLRAAVAAVDDEAERQRLAALSSTQEQGG